MATLPAAPFTPVDDYLRTAYSPDVEYVDGLLIPRGMPAFLHSLLQKILLAWFDRWEEQYAYTTLPELRTQIVERSRYRIPGVLLCFTPTRIRTVMNEVPLAVIEILSPDDTVQQTLARFADYAALGVPHILQLDPESHTAHRYQSGSLIQTQFTTLPSPKGDIPFDTAALFAELRARVERATR
ncbi:MAG: Uma2 family endonuclease [Bryobacteraceae bacterium]|nr:Uma2 family endonuclease [Bryobacteraceae bacterium]